MSVPLLKRDLSGEKSCTPPACAATRLNPFFFFLARTFLGFFFHCFYHGTKKIKTEKWRWWAMLRGSFFSGALLISYACVYIYTIRSGDRFLFMVSLSGFLHVRLTPLILGSPGRLRLDTSQQLCKRRSIQFRLDSLFHYFCSRKPTHNRIYLLFSKKKL